MTTTGTKVIRRTYAGELEWVIEQINIAFSDRNSNRASQINRLCEYGRCDDPR